MNDEQMVNQVWEVAARMVKFAALGVLILVGGVVALVAAVIGLVSTFGGRFGRAFGERLSEAREWTGRVAALFVTTLCLLAPAGAVGWGVYRIWQTYDGESWTWVLLAGNLVIMPMVLALWGGMNRGAGLLVGLLIFGISWLSVSSPAAAIVLASSIRLSGNYILWRQST